MCRLILSVVSAAFFVRILLTFLKNSLFICFFCPKRWNLKSTSIVKFFLTRHSSKMWPEFWPENQVKSTLFKTLEPYLSSKECMHLKKRKQIPNQSKSLIKLCKWMSRDCLLVGCLVVSDSWHLCFHLMMVVERRHSSDIFVWLLPISSLCHNTKAWCLMMMLMVRLHRSQIYWSTGASERMGTMG